MTETGTCRICWQQYDHWGHNPWPLANGESHRCCDKCNEVLVQYARSLRESDEMTRQKYLYMLGHEICFDEREQHRHCVYWLDRHGTLTLEWADNTQWRVDFDDDGTLFYESLSTDPFTVDGVTWPDIDALEIMGVIRAYQGWLEPQTTVNHNWVEDGF